MILQTQNLEFFQYPVTSDNDILLYICVWGVSALYSEGHFHSLCSIYLLTHSQ